MKSPLKLSINIVIEEYITQKVHSYKRALKAVYLSFLKDKENKLNSLMIFIIKS